MLGSAILSALLGLAPPSGQVEGPQPPPPKVEPLPVEPASENVEPPSENVEPPSENLEPPSENLEPPEPAGTTPPGEREGPAIPEPGSEPEPDPDELEAAIAAAEDLPYFPTAARKSAIRRNNEVMVRSFRRPVYTIAAAARLGTLIGGQQVVQPVGWGAAMQLRLHFLRVVKSRFGVEIIAGHTRFQQRRDYESFTGNSLTRISLLTHTDFSAGPSVQIPLGAVFLQMGASAGVAVSTLLRPLSADSSEDEMISETDFLLRGGLSLGVPILNRHGLTIGAGVQHMFSNREVAVDPVEALGVDPDADPPADIAMTTPFSTWLEVFLGYQIWF